MKSRPTCFARATIRSGALFFLGLFLASHVRAETSRVTLDGRFDDWPTGTTALADGGHLYFRLALPEVTSLQTSPVTTEILLDLDADAATGRRVEPMGGAADAFGVDLALVFAPAETRSGRGVGSGASASAWSAAGEEARLPHPTVGFAALPTHASDQFEVRLSRHLAEQPRTAELLRRAGTGRFFVRRLGADGAAVWESGPVAFERPAAAASAAQADAEIPVRPEDAVRLLSANVEWAAPLTNPAPFARLLKAVRPDIVLLQEWDRSPRGRGSGSAPMRESAEDIARWFNTHAPGERPWQVRRTTALGVAIAARDPLTPLGGDRATYRLEDATTNLLAGEVRVVGALAATRLGPVAVASLHLKCCGGLATTEDLQRQAEAVTISAAIRRALTGAGAVATVIGGDFNLVGAVTPKTIIAAGLDHDGSALTVAEPRTLGGASAITWRDPNSPFAPSRLDFMLYSDSTAQASNAFVLDTAVLSDSSLRRHGLERDDSAFSDHLPLVLDLRLRAGVRR